MQICLVIICLTFNAFVFVTVLFVVKVLTTTCAASTATEDSRTGSRTTIRGWNTDDRFHVAPTWRHKGTRAS